MQNPWMLLDPTTLHDSDINKSEQIKMEQKSANKIEGFLRLSDKYALYILDNNIQIPNMYVCENGVYLPIHDEIYKRQIN